MKRCLNPICGLPNDDLAKVCKFCGSKNFVHIETPHPSVPAAEVGLLTRAGAKTASEPALDAEVHSEKVNPATQSREMVTQHDEVADQKETDQAINKANPEVAVPIFVAPTRSTVARWIKRQFTEHLQRSIGILSLLFTIIALPPVIHYWRQFTNHRPVIRTIRPGQNSILIGEEVSLTAVANDSDGDVLQYEWASSAGEILGNGPDVVLRTSGLDRRSVPYEIKVTLTVRDRQDLESTSYSLPIRVSTTKPILRSIEPDKYDVRVGEPVKLIAIADDPGGERAGKLHYDWDCSVGQIDRTDHYKTTLQTTGMAIRTTINPTVNLTVSNDRGESDHREITLSIEPAPRRRLIIRVVKPIGAQSSGSDKSGSSVQTPPQASPQPKEERSPGSATKVPELGCGPTIRTL